MFWDKPSQDAQAIIDVLVSESDRWTNNHTVLYGDIWAHGERGISFQSFEGGSVTLNKPVFIEFGYQTRDTKAIQSALKQVKSKRLLETCTKGVA